MNQQSKFSLKTKQFTNTKRKHAIFQKDKSASSLQIHQPQKQQQYYNDIYKFSSKGSQSNLHGFEQNSLYQPQNLKIKSPEIALQTLEHIKLVLLNNEQNINRLNASTSKLYENHATSLGELVHRRCKQFSNLLRKTFRYVQQKQQQIAALDKRIWIFENTMRQNRQNFRIIKIKQDCIQALIKTNRGQHTQDSMVQLDRDFIITQDMVQSTSSHHPQSLKFRQGYDLNPQSQTKSSPFQANQLLRNSNHFQVKDRFQQPVHNLEEYSFNRYRQIQSRENYRKKENSIEKIQLDNERNQFYDQDHDVNKDNQIQNILEKQQQFTLWIDALDCLRRKNGSYVLDDQGSPIINSSKVYKILRYNNLLQST